MKRFMRLGLTILSLMVATILSEPLVHPDMVSAATEKVQVDLGLGEPSQLTCQDDPCTTSLDNIEITVPGSDNRTLTFREMIVDRMGIVMTDQKHIYKRSWIIPGSPSKFTIERPDWNVVLPEGNYEYRLYLNQKLVVTQPLQVDVVTIDEDDLSQEIALHAFTARGNFESGFQLLGDAMSSVAMILLRSDVHNYFENEMDLLAVTVNSIKISPDGKVTGELKLQNRSESTAIERINMIQVDFRTLDSNNDRFQTIQNNLNLALQPNESTLLNFETTVENSSLNPDYLMARLISDYEISDKHDPMITTTMTKRIEATKASAVAPIPDTELLSGVTFRLRQNMFPNRETETIDLSRYASVADIPVNAMENGKNILSVRVNQVKEENWYTLGAHVTLQNHSTRQLKITSLATFDLFAFDLQVWQSGAAWNELVFRLKPGELNDFSLLPGESRSYYIRFFSPYVSELSHQELGFQLYTRYTVQPIQQN